MIRLIHRVKVSLWSLGFVVAAVLLTACSNDDYLNVIPKNSTALVSVDVPKVASAQKGVSESLMKAWFHISDDGDCGIDLNANVYLFEAPDGNLGMVARVSDEDDVLEWLDKMFKQGRCQKVQKRRDSYFTVLNKSWLAGFNDKAFLVMGPVVPVEQAELMRMMMKYLKAEEGTTDTPMFGRLQEIDAPVAMVSQAQALPEQFVAPFTLGAPLNTPPEKVMIAASMDAKNGCMVVRGETFSFDQQVDAALQQSANVWRKTTSAFLNLIPSKAQYALLMNIDGERMLPLMKQSEAFRALLTGMSVKIDIDGFMQRVDGDLLMVVSPAENGKAAVEKNEQTTAANNEQMTMRWAAQNKSGAAPLDEESEAELARTRLAAADSPLPASVLKEMEGARMCMLMSLNGFDGEKKIVVEAFTSLLKPLFGQVEYILYKTESQTKN